jgi:hypothetical protein
MQVKIQLNSSIVSINIEKEIKSRNTKFCTYKLKQERSFKVVFKYMQSSNVDDFKREIEDHGHIVTNIWIIKKQGTSKTLLIFYIKMKSENKL